MSGDVRSIARQSIAGKKVSLNFVSSLPRRGQLLICPKCRIALAGALGGLI